MSNKKTCPDCQRAMVGIRMIDKAHGPRQKTLEYAAGDAKPGILFGRVPIMGQIEGFLCDKCGRVLLYAKPKDQ
ncbi:MAG: hypothetical protein KJ749_13540 [Planctomycetes bacterium]|nr:hypothetical protein [Planctomycetota bacterium]